LRSSHASSTQLWSIYTDERSGTGGHFVTLHEKQQGIAMLQTLNCIDA